MEIAFQILKQLPSGLARTAVVAALAVLFFLPEMRRRLKWQLWEDDRLERAKKLLELRQLEIQVEELTAGHPESKNDYLDGQIKTLMAGSPTEKPVIPKPVSWRKRLQYALAGSLALMTLGTIALYYSGKFDGQSPLHAIAAELGYTVICGTLVSTIPARHNWECVFRGFVIPVFLGALVAAAIGNA